MKPMVETDLALRQWRIHNTNIFIKREIHELKRVSPHNERESPCVIRSRLSFTGRASPISLRRHAVPETGKRMYSKRYGPTRAATLPAFRRTRTAFSQSPPTPKKGTR